MARKLNRRTFLRGMGGTCIALPVLESMLDDHGVAYAGGGALPLRFMMSFGGFSIGTDGLHGGGGIAPVVPDATGPGYDIKPGLQPLATYDVADEITVVSGMVLPKSTSPGPGERYDAGGLFHRHINPLITGNRQQGSNNGTVTGPSSDTLVGEAIGGGTTFQTLRYKVQALGYNQAGIEHPNQAELSYDHSGTSLPATTSPRLAFTNLFTGFVPPDPADALTAAFELRKRQSVLDVVDRRMGGLLGTLSTSDQQRMQRHYDEIRALESRLEAMPPDVTEQCYLLDDPGADPPLGGEPVNGSAGAYDVNVGYSDENERAEVFADLLRMAFTCDLTRSAAWMLTYFQSSMNFFPLTSHQHNLHGLTHEASATDLGDGIAWHVDRFAYLVDGLRNTPEGAGTVLDNCALVLMPEAGYGPVTGGGTSAHATENMLALVAGGAGGLARGTHIVSNAHPTRVITSAMKAVGLADTLGEVSGTIPGLIA